MVVSPSARVRISSKESMVVYGSGCWLLLSLSSSLAKSTKLETTDNEEGRDQIRQNLITLV
jgi:hypothetical protein